MNNKGYKALKKYWKENGWTREEVKILKKNYKQTTDEQMVEKLNHRRSSGAISGKRLELGLRKGRKTRQGIMQKHQIWSLEEVEVLLEVWRDYDQRQISEKFIPTKTPEQVNHKKMHMGLKKPPVWTNDQRALLLEHGANYTQGQLQALFFPDKDVKQIAGMRKHLGITRRRK